MERVRLFALFLIFSVFVTTEAVDWPRIRVKDGHLIFTVEKDKNISLLTTGQGAIHVNGEDISHVTKLARNLTNFITTSPEVYLPNLPDGTKTTLFDQVQLVDSALQNLTKIAVTRPVTQRMNRRINTLNRKLRRLLTLLHINDCLSNPCENGGTCQDLFNDYMCLCPPEWKGETCDVDVDECENFAGTDLGCQNGATCINKPGSYMCSCTNGWNGIHCTKKDTDCATGGAELCGHGVCVPQSNSFGYKCICDQGWKTDGTNPPCNVDVNECDTFPCSKTPLVQCINVPGSFFCGHCPPGYTGNGYHCNDVNECEIYNGGCSINPKVLCINTPGSRTCGYCPPNYIGDGIICTFGGGACGFNNGGCHPLAQCRHTSGVISTFVECICPPGYVGNGMGPNGCLRSHQTVGACSSNPCVHGTCSPANATGYLCVCNAGFRGVNCENSINSCESNPCKNGGTCIENSHSFYCKCTSDFTGLRCEVRENVCGGRLTSYAGILEYPPSDSSIQYKHNCAWVIKTNSTKVLTIKFTKFNIKESGNCGFDWLQIHDGKNSAAPSLGRYCGNALPNNGTILSTHNYVYLWYRGESAASGNSFALNWESTEPVCYQEIIVKSHGVIRSPGFPGNYPNNRDCSWKLIGPMGKRIEFHFFSLTIGDDAANCTKDYLEILSHGPWSKPFVKYCNTSHPPPLVSPLHIALVHFHSDEKEQYPGFQISYNLVSGIPNCGGVYTKETGIIQGPRIADLTDLIYNRYVLTAYECEYKIIVPIGMRVKIEFISFNILNVADQCREYLKIFEGSSAEDPLIGTYCGNNLPPIYISVSNTLFLLYKTRLSVGFSLKYDSICGGVFMGSSGIIQSSGYPNYTHSMKECIYEIIQEPGTIITLNVLDFSREHYVNCQLDSIEIRDGENQNAALIGNYCQNAPVEVVSTHNALWIKIKASRIVRKKFYMNYTTTDVGCGGIFKANTSTIQSPSHPFSYSSGLKCTWMIVAPVDKVIQLSWVTFKLENSYECKYDHVEVYDNNTSTGMGGLMGRFCGATLPPILLSSSNIMTITFETDASINQDGFIGSYTFLPASSICGGTFFTPSGVIKSPYYPKSYPINKDCKWVIKVPSGNQIMLNVTDFQMEGYMGCRYDFLEIRNGGSASSPLIGKFCGTTIPKLIPSHANQLYFHFKSDFTRNGKGFKIFWTSTATGCGGSLTSARGSIISPNYPEPYDKNTVCVWKVSVNAGSTVQLVFADMDLENHFVCRLDYVEIFDGFSPGAKSLGRFCNSAHPPVIKSTSNHVLVKFKSDISDQGRGFQLQYSTVCDNKIEGYGGVIESPNFPNGYPHNQDCTWEIGVPFGNKINLTFSHFELEKSYVISEKKCQYDYVEISYVSDESTSIVDRLCGNEENTKMITVDANNTKIHFVTDNLLVGNGFRLEWQLFGCGGILDSPEGTIQSLNYPENYPTGLICQWIISLPTVGKSVEIHFDDVFMESSDMCYSDYIEVYHGRTADPDNLIAKLCSIYNVTTLTSNGHEMFVLFYSDFSNTGKGFHAHYKTVNSSCGGTINAESGFIMSPNYPKNYDKKVSCEWLIIIKEHHLINFEFLDVDLIPACERASIKLFDGPGEGYPLLTNVCGDNKPNNTFTSSYNHMFVTFKASSITTAKGFKAEFKTACGAVLDSETSGLIQYEYKTTFITKESLCHFTIVAPNPQDHVSLTVTYIHGDFCEYVFSSFNVYNGYNDSDPLIGEYCAKIPPMITSDGNALTITTNVGFKASYTTFSSVCGGTLEHETGYFSTPNYPNDYPVDIECEWTLNVSRSLPMTITFNAFELVESEFCNEDFVEIRALDDNNKLLGAFCGNDVPTNITAIGTIWIYFKSSKPDVGTLGQKKSGFMAEYTMGYVVELSGSSGLIYSPLYPDFYKKVNTFTWRITVGFGHRIHLTSKEFFFEFAYGSDTGFCFYTYLTIYDGFNDQAPAKDICNEVAVDFYSSSNAIVIRAAFDVVMKGSRFLLKWDQINRVQTSLIPKIGNSNTNNTCGNNFTIDVNENSGFYKLKSPGYPDGYARGLNCEWMFSTISQNHLTLKFTDLKFINTMNCMADKVLVYTGADTITWKLLETACTANSTAKEIEGGNLIKVVFNTNPINFGNSSGFAAVIEDRCGGNIKASNGVIRMTEDGKAKNTNCQWNVTVRSGRTISVQFKRFNLGENSNGHCENFLVLRNGQYSDSPFLGTGKYCGRTFPEKLVTTANHLYVKYKSVGNVPGFIMEFKEVSIDCGGKIYLTNLDNSTTITSPNYPNIPQPYSECIWIIRAPPGESLRLDFEDRFDLTKRNNCEVEYVEVRDGGTELSQLIGKYCTDMPSTQFTTDNMLYVKFFTQAEDPRNGFKAKVTIKTCGGVIRENDGRIQSPYYGSKNFYPQNIECTWHIVGPRDHYLNLTLESIDITSRIGDCNDALLEFYDKGLYNKTLLLSACRMPEINSVLSMRNEVIVKFKSGSGKNLSGFSVKFKASQETCGGKVTATSGYIQSPGYPVMNHNQRFCEWEIEVPKGRRIKVEILDLDLDKTSLVYEQGLAFFNDHYLTSELEYLKPGDRTKFVNSTDNVMVIYFWSSHVSNHRGFKLFYSSDEPGLCLGDFEKEYGVIYSPQNISIFRCSYDRLAKENIQKTVLFKIDSAKGDFPHVTNCAVGATILEIQTKLDGEYVTLGEYCNSLKTSKYLRVPYPYIRMINTQSAGQKPLNFTVQYSTQTCGGILKAPFGTISSPGYPNTPTKTYDCVWVIDLEENQAVKLNFTSLDLDPDCEKGFLIIHNGHLKTSPQVKVYCGNNVPPSFVSQSNGLWIEYHVDVSSNSKGFQFNYEPVVGGCGGDFHDPNRLLQSPNYPEEYPDNSECDWVLHAPTGYHVGLEFNHRFHLEDSGNCENDYLAIYDVVDNKETLLKNICGREAPDYINSTSSTMKVMFRSNSKVSQSGFRASWRFNCGGNFTASSETQIITSPGYPNNYMSNMHCVYNISASMVELRFLEMNLEHGDDNCLFDNVTISYPFFGSIIKNTYCGTMMPPLYLVRKYVTITFRSDNFLNRRGFKVTYKNDECGGVIDKPTEIIGSSAESSIDTMQYFRRYRTCVWNITAPKDKVVVVQLEKLVISYTPDCFIAYLALYEGYQGTKGQLLAKLCGNYTTILNPERLPVIRSQSNKMTVHYRNHGPSGIFKALVFFTDGPSVGCGKQYVIDEKKTLLIEGPENIRDADCHYEFSTTDGYYLTLKFIETEGCIVNTTAKLIGNCSCSSFEIRDGGGPFSELIDVLCDQLKTSVTYKTTGARAWLRWKTTSLYNGKKFKLEVSSALSTCGVSTLVADSSPKQLLSPNYPMTYPSDLKCSWRITLPKNATCCLMLKFNDFDLGDVPETAETCNNDKVSISDIYHSTNFDKPLGMETIFALKSRNVYPSRFANVLSLTRPFGVHDYCGKLGHEYDYYSESKEVRVDFESFAGNHGKGFKLNYGLTGCDRNLTGQQGRVVARLTENLCNIIITSPIDTTISIYFTTYTAVGRNCEEMGINVFDGPSVKSSNLTTICPSRVPNPVFSTQNVVLLQLFKKSSMTYYGAPSLDFTYTSTREGRGCGGKIYNYYGTFTSPLYPEDYPDKSDCTWEVYVPYGLDMELHFTVFSIPNRCLTDNLTVTTYAEGVPSEHTFCGTDTPPKLRSSNKLKVRYTTSFKSGAIGWIAKFTVITDRTTDM